jgi:phosphoglycerate dehydrogenase-like enzyme
MSVHRRPLKIILTDTAYRAELEKNIRSRLPDTEIVTVSVDGDVEGDLDGAEIFFAWGLEGEIIEPVVKQAKDLRWFHLLSAGVESLMFPALKESDILLTNARGVFAIPIAESVLAVMFYVAKNLKGNFENVSKRHWERLPREELFGATAGILGLGAIGGEVARRLTCLGMRVTGLKRNPDNGTDLPIEKIYSPGELKEFLKQSDWVIVCSALTDNTYEMLGEEEFRIMKPTAWYINIARGEIADENALLKALNEGWIGGAAMDAFSQEPLPTDSPFWNHPRVVVTPHNAGTSKRTPERNLALALDNLDRYLLKKPLRNLVDKQAGY